MCVCLTPLKKVELINNYSNLKTLKEERPQCSLPGENWNGVTNLRQWKNHGIMNEVKLNYTCPHCWSERHARHSIWGQQELEQEITYRFCT